jgi:dynein heavy chain
MLLYIIEGINGQRKLQENPSEKQFDFSEMYVFGKFDSFCKRIGKVVELLNIMEKFGMIDRLAIEGMDTITKRFGNVLSQLQRKPYDILDQRKNVPFTTLILY